MVRLVFAAALLLSAPAAASAQDIDWSRAGGDLFGRPFAAQAAEPEDGDDLRLAPLTQPFGDAVAAAAARHGLDPKLLHALVMTESAYRSNAVSPAGAAGLTQLMPATARELGVEDRFDPVENLRGGADYLARQLRRFQDVRLALAAFNAGPARVASLGRVPRIRETEEYVESVIECYLALSAGRVVVNARQCRREGAP
ncbi:Membrane-bound lytic murein transglycosylase F precursor [Brevundimonas diminuta]|jgi:soluble lytic murein transglycosylase-like protein|nr:lytic transglycosylase domain-containing protein [Brevundimonas diminuta]NWE53211.1 lytic transglycosylase domain-containing protein [Brevundimonas sp. P7753]SPU47782.1 Membrane-bound lytic murein transglycosylase F precursor [Brevundimonas diminuta]